MLLFIYSVFVIFNFRKVILTNSAFQSQFVGNSQAQNQYLLVCFCVKNIFAVISQHKWF